MAKRKQGVVVRAAGGGASAAAKAAALLAPPTPADGAEGEEPAPSAEAPAAGAASSGPARKKKRRSKPDGSAAAVQDAAPASPASPTPASASIAPAEAAAGAAAPDSAAAAGAACGDSLEWLCWPLGSEKFLAEHWERKPLHLKRQRPAYYGEVFSKAALDKHLAEGTPLGYEDRLNISRFDEKTGKKVVLNPGPRGTKVCPKDVNSAWAAGASLQVMHPQQFHEPVWRLLTNLERSFGSLFGANAYITPGGRQGFAPHFDDVEVFMLQVEGAKRWRLYEPPAGEEFPLPREYSRDFEQAELGEPVLDVLLEAGDMLYLPRGFIHQGIAAEDAGFSHHLTVSTYMKTAWCQLMERALSSAVEKAAAESEEFREGLPVGFLRYMGSWHDKTDVAEHGGSASVGAPSSGSTSAGIAAPRAAFIRRFQGLLKRLQEFVDLDEVCDEMGVEFMHERLPPAPASAAPGGGSAASAVEGVTLDARVRWIDASAQRAMLSTDPETSEPTVLLFHSRDNERDGHMSGAALADAEAEVGCLRFEAAIFLPALRALLALPAGASLRCGDLPLQDADDRVALCQNFLEAGLLELTPSEPEAPAAAV